MEKEQKIEKIVDYATARFADGDFETVKKVLSTLSGEKNCSTDLKYLQAKYAIHEGKNIEAESLLSNALSKDHLVNRNIIRVVFNLPKSRTLVELMKKIITKYSEDLAQIGDDFRKEFLIKAAVYYKDLGKRKEAMECLLDQTNGPNILDDDYTVRLAAALQPAHADRCVEAMQKNKALLGVYYFGLYKKEPEKVEHFIKKETERKENINTRVLLEIINFYIQGGKLQRAEEIANLAKTHVPQSDTDQVNELQCLIELTNSNKLENIYTKQVVEERIKFLRRVTSILEISKTKRLIRISATILWTITLPLLEPQLKLGELEKFVIGALNMIVSIDSTNINAYNAYRELSRFSIQKENLTAGARYLIQAVNLCTNPDQKKKLHCEARMISAAVNLYNRPESDLEHAGKLIQEASIATPTKITPFLIQAGRILSLNFIEQYQNQKRLFPFNPAIMSSYKSAFQPVKSSLKEEDVTVLELWYKILKLARKNGCWRLLRLVGRQIAAFQIKTDEPSEPDNTSISTLENPKDTRPTTASKKQEKTDVNSSKAEDDKSKICAKEISIARICCESMLLESEGWIQLLRKAGSDLFIYSDNQDSEVKEVENMISEFVVKLMKDCLSLATEYDLNYLVHNASVYLWNYAQKLRKSGNMTHIPMMFLQAFDCLTVKNDLATNLIVQMGTVLANSPLVTKHEEARSSIASDTSGSKSPSKNKKSATVLSADDQHRKRNLTAALEICERAIEVRV